MDLTKFNGHQFGIEANTKAEADFLLNQLKPHHIVLEWGSGASTITIASKVKKVYSIEHNLEWFNEMGKCLPKNAEMAFVRPNKPEGQEKMEPMNNIKIM